jgi:hypothetical protein
MKSISAWILLGVMFFVLVAGGCGGGGGGNDDSTPIPSPAPAPVEPEPGPEPEPEQFDFAALSGEWRARDGQGTATGEGGPYTLKLNEGRAVISIVDVNDQEAYVDEAIYFVWDVYAGSVLQETLTLYDTEIERALVTNVEFNQFRYTFPGGRSTITVTIYSSTLAYVEEQGIWTNEYGEFPYSGSYYMDKVKEF